jgi:hypothetical protein
VLQSNSLPLTVDDQAYVMQFTRLIASKAMTDSMVAVNSCGHSHTRTPLQCARQHDNQDLDNRMVIGSATKMRKTPSLFR